MPFKENSAEIFSSHLKYCAGNLPNQYEEITAIFLLKYEEWLKYPA